MINLKIPFNASPYSSQSLFRRWWFGWVPFWIYNCIVFQGAILPLERVPSLLTHINDKILHAVEYFLLFFFAVNAFEKARSFWIRMHPRTKALVWCLLMGIITEWAQSFVPTRSSSASDWMADLTGAVVALVLCGPISKLKQNSEI